MRDKNTPLNYLNQIVRKIMLAKNEIKFLIIDYDGCAHTNFNQGKRKDHLSPDLVTYARSGGYEGFYGCTHRCYLSQLWYLWTINTIQATLGFHVLTPDFMENDLTYKITLNFAKASELANMAVSTRDDYFYENCGDAYKNITEPYEQKGQIPSEDASYLTPGETFSNWEILSNFANKNLQLIQIAQHAKNKFPNSTIILDYVDDREYISMQAAKLCEKKDWPEDVILNIYKHRPDAGNSDIVPITPKELTTNKLSSSLCKMGLFAFGVVCTGLVIDATIDLGGLKHEMGII